MDEGLNARRGTREQRPWRGTELFGRPEWELVLSPEDNAELAQAIDRSRDLTPEALTAQTFHLPVLGDRLRKMGARLETGPGATLLRGLDLGELSKLDLEDGVQRAFTGLAHYVGTPVSQSATGERLLSVRDAAHTSGDKRVRGPNTNRRLSFHTDRCDVIAFLCVRPARSGGETHILSSVALAARLAKDHPGEFETLKQPFPYLRHTIDTGNARNFVELPVFSEHEGFFAASLLRVLIDRAHADPNAPSLTKAQIRALDCLESVAEDTDLFAKLTLGPGDMLFLNNWTTFHRRTAFEDDDEGPGRLLWRLWLSVPGSRPLAPCFADHFGSTAPGAIRGGIHPKA